MTLIPTTVATRGAGADLSSAVWTTASSGVGDTFAPGPDNWLRVHSTNTSTVTVTVMAAADNPSISGTFLAPLALAPVVGANTGDRIYGPFPSSPFASQTDGLVHVTYSSNTGVQVQVLNFSAT